jgi:hypothetical protein
MREVLLRPEVTAISEIHTRGLWGEQNQEARAAGASASDKYISGLRQDCGNEVVFLYVDW